ncbi:MAG: NAD-dependent deacylase [Hyphomicrobiaceae bacterium]
MARYDHIVILTGSGISAESGIATFRDRDGIWSRYDYRDVATPEGFARNPDRVHEFYNMRVNAAAGAKPNAAHLALAHLEREHARLSGSGFALITQNVDLLHEAAGSSNVVHMHGSLGTVLCAACGDRHPRRGDLSTALSCPSCEKSGGLRPDVVWFGEMPYHMDHIQDLLDRADLFISIGTSGTVYPAAGFVERARSGGAHTVELNLEPSHGISAFDEAVQGAATQVVPAFVDRLLANR